MAALRAKTTDFERITSDEFEQMPQFEDGLHELIEGKIEKKSMPGDEHGTIVMQIIKRLARLDFEDKLGKYWTDTSVELEPYWNPKPDFVFVVAAKVQPTSKKSIKVVPDLVVEVNSPEDLNTVAKRQKVAAKIAKYQEKGVSIVWSITPATQTVQVFHPNQPTPVQILGINDELDGENIIPGFKMRVADLFV